MFAASVVFGKIKTFFFILNCDNRLVAQSLTNKLERSEPQSQCIIVQVILLYVTHIHYKLQIKSRRFSGLSSFDIIMYTMPVTLPGTLIRKLNLDNPHFSQWYILTKWYMKNLFPP